PSRYSFMEAYEISNYKWNKPNSGLRMEPLRCTRYWIMIWDCPKVEDVTYVREELDDSDLHLGMKYFIGSRCLPMYTDLLSVVAQAGVPRTTSYSKFTHLTNIQ